MCLYCEVECCKIVFSSELGYCSVLDFIECDLVVDVDVLCLEVVVSGYMGELVGLLV